MFIFLLDHSSGMYDFFMNDVDSLEVIADYNSYHMANYDIATVDRPREVKAAAPEEITLKGSKSELQT